MTPSPTVRSAVYYPANDWVLLDVLFPGAAQSISDCFITYKYASGDSTFFRSSIKYPDITITPVSADSVSIKMARSLFTMQPLKGDIITFFSFEYYNSTILDVVNSPQDTDIPIYVYGQETISTSVSAITNTSATISVVSSAPMTDAPTVYNSADASVISSTWNGANIILANLTSASQYSIYISAQSAAGVLTSPTITFETYANVSYSASVGSAPGTVSVSVLTAGIKSISSITGGAGSDSGSKSFVVSRIDNADPLSDISGIVVSGLLFNTEYVLTIAAVNSAGGTITNSISASSSAFPTLSVVAATDTTITLKPSYASVSSVRIVNADGADYAIDSAGYLAGTSDVITVSNLAVATSYTFILIGTINTKPGTSPSITSTTNKVGITIDSVDTASFIVNVISYNSIIGTPILYNAATGAPFASQIWNADAKQITITGATSAFAYNVYAIVPTSEGNTQTSSLAISTRIAYTAPANTQPGAITVQLTSSGIKSISNIYGGYYFLEDDGFGNTVNRVNDQGDKQFTITRAGDSTSDIITITVSGMMFATSYTLDINAVNAAGATVTAQVNATTGSFPTITATSVATTSVILTPSYTGVSDPHIWNADNAEYGVAVSGVVDALAYVNRTSSGITVSGLSPSTAYTFRLFGAVGEFYDASPVITITTTAEDGSGGAGTGSGGSGGADTGSGGSGGAGSGGSSGSAVPCIPNGQRILTQRGLVPIEALQKGDQLATADSRLVDFKFYKATISAINETDAPIRIEAGAIGNTSAVELSPLHMIQARRGVWVKPAELLAAGVAGVSRVRVGETVTYYHVEMPNYLRDNMVVEGCTVESFGLPWVKRSGFKGSPYTWNARLNGYTRLASWTGKTSTHT